MASLTTHFRTMSVPDPSQDPPVEMTVGELVSPGDLLVSVPATENVSAGALGVEAGIHTEFTDDGRGIIATCHGYPSPITVISAGNRKRFIHLTPLISKADDLMEARLNLYPPMPETSILDQSEILDLIKQYEIVYGIDVEALQYALECVTEKGLPVLDSLIARGRAPLHGKDAYLRYEIEIGPLPGKLLGDGSIDFRERMMFVGVAENQLLATRVPPTSGTPGKNIAGIGIATQEGNDIQIKLSDDAHFDPVDNTVRATASGVLSIVGDDTIRVLSKQRIDGDVDFSTGNIRSQNAVEITGSIHPEFMVSTLGDLSIGGNVQDGTVNSHGNLTVQGGLIGPATKVRVQGDAEINYIEHGLLSTGGNIVIRSSAYYSTIHATGNIHCPEKVKIVGGEIVAGGSLSAGQIGSMSGKPIHLAVGASPVRYRRYLVLQQEYQNILETIENWYNRFGTNGGDNKTVRVQEEKLSGIEQELSHFNLIPGTPEGSLGNHRYFFTEAAVTTHGVLAAGTVLRIGNEVTVIEQDVKGCTVSMDRESGAIKFS